MFPFTKNGESQIEIYDFLRKLVFGGDLVDLESNVSLYKQTVHPRLKVTMFLNKLKMHRF